MRDVRSFTISQLDNLLRKSRAPQLPEKLFFHWYRGNRISYAAAKLISRPLARVMYETMCLATEAASKSLATSLGVQYIDTSANLDSGITHIIAGNRMRFGQRVKHLVYDYRWLARSEWLRPYALLPMVRKYNEQCLRECGMA